jgi:hypothetical protein
MRSPAIFGSLTNREEWKMVFYIPGVGYVVAGVLDSDDETWRVEYPGLIVITQRNGVAHANIVELVPQFFLNQRELTEGFPITRSLVMFHGRMSTELNNMYFEFTRKMKAKFTGIVLPS